ncbi:MAG: LptF/LptG family permease [Balneolaceae bacterium]|nr:LptF/LptG family permease [Balneolaceae bacterium]
MIKKFDRHIFGRLTGITLFVLGVLIFVFIIFDFSEHSDEFTDRGATMGQIFGTYYLNYIPEMFRLVMPMAVFVAVLYLTGQLSERLEIIALKAAGVSLYRLLAPYLVFAFLVAGAMFYLDGWVIPDANAKRIAFESRYLTDKSQRVDRNQIYRQESENALYRINYFNANEQVGYTIEVVNYAGDSLQSLTTIDRMRWAEGREQWVMYNIQKRVFDSTGFTDFQTDSADTTLNILPRDITRTTSDIYQLTYPEAQNYIASIERSGAGSVGLPKIQYYGRLAYPLSVIVITIVGFSIAAVRRKGGKAMYIAAGLAIAIIYLVFMKIMEPVGSKGAVDPAIAALLPHLSFFVVGMGLLISARK